MKISSLQRPAHITLGVMLATVSLSAFGFLGFGTDSWQEEVLLHDGSKLIVSRSQNYGGRHEIGQPSPIKEHTVAFILPSSGKSFVWKSEYGDDIGRANFGLLAIHVLDGTPYVVAEPNLCLSYSKWGRPNPPYVFFKHDGKGWRRISLQEFPAEFKSLNVSVYLGSREVEMMVRQGTVSSQQIAKANSEMRQPEYKAILREALPESALCPQYSSSPKAPIPMKPKAPQE
ncbi:MAG: hypothetical protein NTW45_02980 [Rhodocyclales bacterium]|nr:hypothetical protein [Rhodocyclales bacterium]